MTTTNLKTRIQAARRMIEAEPNFVMPARKVVDHVGISLTELEDMRKTGAIKPMVLRCRNGLQLYYNTNEILKACLVKLISKL